MIGTGIFLLLLSTFGSCSRFPYISVIDSGEIFPALGKIPVFTHFWIYGSVTRLPSRARCNTKYQERFTGTMVNFSWNSFSLDSPNFSITSNRICKLSVSEVPQTCRLLAFDNTFRTLDDVHAARAAGANLSFICLIVSDDDTAYLQLRSQALSLIGGTLVPTLLKSGHLMACVRVVSSGILRPDVLPKLTTDFGAPINIGRAFTYSPAHQGTSQYGTIKIGSRSGTFFENVFVYGYLPRPISFDTESVEINDGYNHISLSRSSIHSDDPKVAILLDRRSGLITVKQNPRESPYFAMFRADGRVDFILMMENEFKPDMQSHICLVFSVEPVAKDILRANVFALMDTGFHLPNLPIGSLLVCVQVLRRRPLKKLVEPYLSLPSNGPNSLLSWSSSEAISEMPQTGAEQPQKSECVNDEISSHQSNNEDMNLDCTNNSWDCISFEPPFNYCPDLTSFSEIDNRCRHGDGGADIPQVSTEDTEFTVALLMEHLFKGCPPN